MKYSICTVVPKQMKAILQTSYLNCKYLLASHPGIPENKVEELRRRSKVFIYYFDKLFTHVLKTKNIYLQDRPTNS